MQIDELIKQIKKELEPIYEKPETLDEIHDWDHVLRVYGACEKILELEPRANRYEVLIAALLHDVGRSPKMEKPHAELSYEFSSDYLKKFQDILAANHLNYQKILGIIKNHTIAHLCKEEVCQTLEFKITTDADKIDMFGPCGVVRVMASGGGLYKNLNQLRKQALPNEFLLQSEGGRQLGKKYKDYLAQFIADFDAQNDFFNNK